MTPLHNDVSPVRQSARVERYYRFHSKIYDGTRWIFLFGRAALIQELSANRTRTNILEVGCGTGKNLINLCRNFPEADITGLDISEEMLKVARKKIGPLAGQVTLLHKAYDQLLQPARPFDLILFSYSLSMINPGWDHAIECAYSDLAQGGLIAVVDFNDSALFLFKRWMRLNHVRMDGHLLPKLESRFQPRTLEIRRAYGGVWTYLIFLGEK
jgi:S-adenosylmethionine-diacylgycerolhomoserine-N-methlytransferase